MQKQNWDEVQIFVLQVYPRYLPNMKIVVALVGSFLAALFLPVAFVKKKKLNRKRLATKNIRKG